ncbi:MAG TPA: DUF4173 domain-containing protein [Leadbetterella sp.]|nr:DUF4173 domain-containing protein [Leadbetterella sp.]
MKNPKNLSFFFCLTVYYFIFWQENIALNLFIFDILLLGFSYQQMPKNLKTNILLTIAFLSSASVPLINTDASILINVLIMGVVLGYSLLPEINSAISAGLVFFINITLNIRHLSAPITNLFEGMASKSTLFDQVLKIIKIGVLPVVLFVVFLVLFQNANPIFLEKTLFLQNALETFFTNFPTFSVPRTVFTIFGYIFLAGVFFNRNFQFGQNYFTNKSKSIEPPIESIKNDKFQTATISLFTLNALLLSVNFIDIQYLWFNFSETSASEMSKLVHSGTYLLIISVIISIIVLLFFFKGELNFHKKSKILVVLAITWIAQNAILVGSVFIRNYKYVEMYGLTHKRIGVCIFLTLTLVGLFTITWKIIKKQNFNFIFIYNSWAFMVVFLIVSFIDFDKIIAENNLKRPNCDMEYVKSLSIHAIPSILKYHPELKKEDLKTYKRYKQESENFTWLSWTLIDYRLQNLK